MSVHSGPKISTTDRVLHLDASNPNSYSKNVHPFPTDIYRWITAGSNCTLSRDTISSPVGNTPLKMVQTGNDPYTNSYSGGGGIWKLAPASAGQTWTVSVWVKASQVIQVEGCWVAEQDSAGNYLAGGGSPNVTIGTNWTRISGTYTLVNASTAYVGLRLDGTQTGGAGVTLWWDGVQLERSSSVSTFNSKTNVNGTMWYDLSGKNNHATMYGLVPTVNDVVTCFDYGTVTGSGSSSASMGFTFTQNMIPTTGSFTFSTWIKNPPASSQIGLFSNSGSGEGYRFGVGSTGVYTLIGGAGGASYSEPTINFLSTLSPTLWYNVVTVFDRAGTNSSGIPQWQVYLNGVLQNTTNMVSPQTSAFANATPGLVRSACCTLYTGKLSTFTAHGRALSSSEILQNFNAQKGRYGI